MTGEASSPSPSLPLPPREREASRSANDARQYNRLRWRCRRGLLELDVVLKNFLEQRYDGLAPSEQAAFEQLLAVGDETLWAYVQGSQNPPEKELMQLVAKIRN